MNKISIIIPVLINSEVKPDEWGCLKLAVESIKKHSTLPHEILVVTNNGMPKKPPIKGITWFHTEGQGQCFAVNVGVRRSKNDYVMIIDDDMIFPPNWEELIEKAKDVEFLSGNLMEKAGSFLNNDCGRVEDFNKFKFEEDAIKLKEDKMENGFGFPLICKKEVWERVGGYDIQYDPWGSNCDSDLEYKLMLAGIMPKRWKGVLFYHFAQVSGTFFPEQGSFHQGNIRKFEMKWGFARARAPEIWSCDFKIPLDKLRYKPSWAKLENNSNIQ